MTEQLPLWPDLAPARPRLARGERYSCACGSYFKSIGPDRWSCEGCPNTVTFSEEHLSVYDCCWLALRNGLWPTTGLLSEALGVSRKQIHGHIARLRRWGLVPPDPATHAYRTGRREGLQEGWALCERGDRPGLVEALADALTRTFGRTA